MCGVNPKGFFKNQELLGKQGLGLVASSHKVEIPKGRLFGSCEGTRIPWRAQCGGLPSELLIKVADICAPRKCRHEGWRQAPGQQDIPAQSLWRGDRLSYDGG